MDPDKVKIPVPMSDARRIYAALGSLKRIAANEGDDEFVQTLDGLMARLKDYHNTVLTERGAGQDALIRGSEEVRPISGNFTSAEGQEVSFGVLGREPDPDEYRWIVLDDGQAKGAKKGARTGSTSGYIDPGAVL